MAGVQTFICLDCGTGIDNPEGTKGFLRCAEGHRVQVLKSRPLWQIGFSSLGIAFWILAVVVHLFQTVWLTDMSRWIVWFLLAVVASSSIYLVVRRARLIKTPSPIGAIGRQYVTIAIGRLIAVGLLGVIAAIQISY